MPAPAHQLKGFGERGHASTELDVREVQGEILVHIRTDDEDVGCQSPSLSLGRAPPAHYRL